MHRLLSFLLFICLFHSCQWRWNSADFNNVGDIAFDKNIDDPNFKICDSTQLYQYYTREFEGSNAKYRGEKPAIEKYFREGYQFPKTIGETGFLTIRFIVNCNGKSGRFRVQGMNRKYELKAFNSILTQQLIQLTKELDGWIPIQKNNKTYDFYQYFTFELEQGQIKNIMP